MNTQKKGMTGKDIITVGIFSAIYFVINFAFMLLSGLHPLLWILMPGLIAVFAGIPFLMMCTKVPKTGAVVLMGFITALIYFVTGQFTVVILIAFAVSCILAELCRICSHYRSFHGNALAYSLFSLWQPDTRSEGSSKCYSFCLSPEYANKIAGKGTLIYQQGPQQLTIWDGKTPLPSAPLAIEKKPVR